MPPKTPSYMKPTKASASRSERASRVAERLSRRPAAAVPPPRRLATPPPRDEPENPFESPANNGNNDEEGGDEAGIGPAINDGDGGGGGDAWRDGVVAEGWRRNWPRPRSYRDWAREKMELAREKMELWKTWDHWVGCMVLCSAWKKRETVGTWRFRVLGCRKPYPAGFWAAESEKRRRASFEINLWSTRATLIGALAAWIYLAIYIVERGLAWAEKCQ